MTDVKPGQIWADSDPRSAGRTLRVERIEGDKAVCTILTNITEMQNALDECAEKGLRTWVKDMRGKTTRISLSRFKPMSTGYRLLED